ncbi:MAG: hypothetical protein IKR85_03305 [Clostridia bacterium]|nr:hypothetical protein [Clostridia bacterium]
MKISLSFENPRLRHGAEKIRAALEGVGVSAQICVRDEMPAPGDIFVCVRGKSACLSDMEAADIFLYHQGVPEGEAFQAETCAGGGIAVAGGSETGALYGCVYLAEKIEREGQLPDELLAYDAPVFTLRGPCVGLQKTTIEPPRRTYEYPITPERFPWFYDREMWTELLDEMLLERANVLYIWSGHPFSSLLRLEKYPEALEVSEQEYRLNHETFLWLAEECDRRGIWLVMKFYNIHIPLPFAEAHGLSLIQDSINPLVKEYTFECVRRFVSEYPNVGLMVCLGEALRGQDNKAEWFADTIVPALKAGARDANLSEEPPLILRGHDCDPEKALGRVNGGYKNLYTMWKYNGEGLTTRLPRGKWQKNHLNIARLGQRHIINVHILADLEPYRFLSPIYIMQCVQAAAFRLGGGGLHLYPLFYWDWPYSPDKTKPRLKQLDRDRLWFRAWLRYAWNPDRDEDAERAYWTDSICEMYGVTASDAQKLLSAGEDAALCETKMLARFGITEGNRQTLSLGMTMSQLTNAARYRPNGELYASVARAGETLEEYAERDARGETHFGETPVYAIKLLERRAEHMKALMQNVSSGNAECARLVSDFESIYLFTKCMCAKLRAALSVLKYKYSCNPQLKGDVSLLTDAQAQLKASLEYYRMLARHNEKTYLYACSMQTRQRKIPFTDGGIYGHWTACLPEFEKEYAAFEKNTALALDGVFPAPPPAGSAPRLPAAEYEIISGAEEYTFTPGESAFTDKDAPIELCASELDGLTGARFSMGEAVTKGIVLKLRLRQHCRVLIGYIDDRGVEYLPPPSLETDTHADDRGGYEAFLIHGAKLKGLKALNVHAFLYEPGEITLDFGTGAFTLIGVISAEAPLVKRDAGLDAESLSSLDWLYE